MGNTLTELMNETKERSFPWALCNQLLLSGGAVTIIIVLSNVLTSQTFGETRFLTAVLAIFAFFSLPGIGPVVLQRIPMYTRKGFVSAIKMQLQWGVGAACGALLFAIAYYVRGNEDLALAFLISGVFAPTANLYLMPGNVWAGLRLFKKKTFYDGLIILSAVLGVTYGAVTFGTVAGTMFSYFGAQSVAAIVALYSVIRQLPDSTDEEINLGADSRYGKQLTLFQIPFALLPALEKVLVFFLLGPVSLALYVIALLPVEHVRTAYRSLLQFFSLPYLQLESGNTKTHLYLAKVASILTAGAVVAVLLFAVFILPLIFPVYVEARQLIVLSAMALFALPAEIFILSLLSNRRIDYLLSYALVTVFADILLFTFLVSLFDLYGAVTAKIIAAFLSAVVAYLLYRRNARSETIETNEKHVEQ